MHLETQDGMRSDDITIDFVPVIFSTDPMQDPCLIILSFDAAKQVNTNLNEQISKPTDHINFKNGVAQDLVNKTPVALISLNKSLFNDMNTEKFKILFTLIHKRTKLAEVTFAAYTHAKKKIQQLIAQQIYLS